LVAEKKRVRIKCSIAEDFRKKNSWAAQLANWDIKEGAMPNQTSPSELPGLDLFPEL
jgi:hypothetical protein